MLERLVFEGPLVSLGSFRNAFHGQRPEYGDFIEIGATLGEGGEPAAGATEGSGDRPPKVCFRWAWTDQHRDGRLDLIDIRDRVGGCAQFSLSDDEHGGPVRCTLRSAAVDLGPGAGGDLAGLLRRVDQWTGAAIHLVRSDSGWMCEWTLKDPAPPTEEDWRAAIHAARPVWVGTFAEWAEAEIVCREQDHRRLANELPGALRATPAAPLARVLLGMGRLIDEAIQGLSAGQYIGPVRRPPTRFEPALVERESTLHPNGEGLMRVLDESTPRRETLNRLLKFVDPRYQIRTAEVGTSATICELLLDKVVGNRTIESSLLDVGSGFAQVLPVLAAVALQRERYGRAGFVMIEQPELHLHPRLAAQLGEVMVGTAKVQGNSGPEPNGGWPQVLVETHSEHLCLRVARCVRTGATAREDVAFVYLSADGMVTRIGLDEHGNFDTAWPGGFFPEAQEEL
jgi:hypothetical protein